MTGNTTCSQGVKSARALLRYETGQATQSTAYRVTKQIVRMVRKNTNASNAPLKIAAAMSEATMVAPAVTMAATYGVRREALISPSRFGRMPERPKANSRRLEALNVDWVPPITLFRLARLTKGPKSPPIAPAISRHGLGELMYPSSLPGPQPTTAAYIANT